MEGGRERLRISEAFNTDITKIPQNSIKRSAKNNQIRAKFHRKGAKTNKASKANFLTAPLIVNANALNIAMALFLIYKFIKYLNWYNNLMCRITSIRITCPLPYFNLISVLLRGNLLKQAHHYPANMLKQWIQIVWQWEALP